MRFCNGPLRISIAVALAALAGCDSKPNVVPVSGTVLLDGSPLPGAFVRFVPLQGRPSIGRTDDQGQFSLTCFKDQDGAVLGVHQVAITAVEEREGSAGGDLWLAPKRYANHQTSGIEKEITGRTDDLTIELTSDGNGPQG